MENREARVRNPWPILMLLGLCTGNCAPKFVPLRPISIQTEYNRANITRAYSDGNPDHLLVLVSRRIPALFQIDIKRLRMFRIPPSEWRNRASVEVKEHYAVDSVPMEKTASLYMFYVRAGEHVRFTDPSHGQVGFIVQDDSDLRWRDTPPPYPFDPVSNGLLKVAPLKDTYRLNDSVQIVLVNESTVSCDGNISVTREISGSRFTVPNPGNLPNSFFTIPARGTFKYAWVPKATSDLLIQGATYRIQVDGTDALEGGGPSAYSTPFRILKK